MNPSELLRHRLRNALQSLLLVLVLAGLLGYLAWILGGPFLFAVVLALVVFGYLVTPVVSPRLVLGMFRGRPIAYREAPRLYDVAGELARRAELEAVPVLYYLPSDVMNAFAVGEGRTAAVALSDGLLRRLTLTELAGVLAHELSHLRHRDTRVMGFADVVSRLTGLLSTLGILLLFVNLPLFLLGAATLPWWTILLLLFAPTLSTLVQLALSRTREYDADVGAVELLGDPTPLASALQKMEAFQRSLLRHFLWPGQRLPDPCLLRTHPDTTQRIERLRAIAGRRSVPPREPLPTARDLGATWLARAL